ncbi:MAG: hypothetical protein EBR13_03985 [Rhodobacteraceae bacterium]|nr:hypothetical protein [Paracoccaceae bacterium]
MGGAQQCQKHQRSCLKRRDYQCGKRPDKHGRGNSRNNHDNSGETVIYFAFNHLACDASYKVQAIGGMARDVAACVFV